MKVLYFVFCLVGLPLNFSIAQSSSDVVCGMKVSDNTFAKKHEGKTYYFCGKGCKQNFSRNPQQYIKIITASNCNETAKNDYADSVNMNLIKEDLMKSSPRRTACIQTESAKIEVNYGSPGVKGRIIWGGLVPYNEVWVTGAHHATKITFSQDVSIEGNIVKAGTYALFTIPQRENWTLILNKNYEQHLADNYDKKDDILRVSIIPEQLENSVYRLTYQLQNKQNNVFDLIISWEKIKLNISVKVLS